LHFADSSTHLFERAYFIVIQPFIRDRFTWLAYFMLAYYAYLQATLGPSVPFIRDELGLNYTVSAFYISAFALGMALAGLTGDRMARRFGRSFLFWGGGLGMALGAVLLMAGDNPAVTIGSTFIMALSGSYLLVMIQSTLSDRHGPNRAFALTEVNIAAVLAASLAPLAVGFGAAQGWTWRPALVAGIAVWVVVTVLTRRNTALPEARPVETRGETRGGRLPKAFWAYWLVVFFSVSVEWCMIFWASTYMESVVGLSKEVAATSVSLFTLAQFVGRAMGSWLTRRYATGMLLLIAGGIVLVGFPLFWLGREPLVNALGLFLCGLGIANLYPLTLAATSTVGQANPDAASGLTSMGSGVAILITPQVLGAAADQIGIQGAYGIVAPLAVAIIFVTIYANRLAKQTVT